MEVIKKKRGLSVLIDFFIVVLIKFIVEAILPNGVFFELLALSFSFYCLLCKDCYKGMSLGKYLMGIQIIDVKTHHIASPWKCVIRNFCYFLGIIELAIFLASSKGLRIGDYLTSTRGVPRDTRLQQKLSLTLYTVVALFAIFVIENICVYLKLGSLE